MIFTQGLIVDSFAGGGGASLGMEMALGRSPDIAINHDAEAIAMHEANHPSTLHLSKNIWKVDPLDYVKGRPVSVAWFSPDCKHFSKAKGGKPVARNIRDLAWVVILWAERVRPRLIFLENVEEFRTWGPLDENDMPCPVRKGQTFKKWVAQLRRLGYVVDFRELRACDYGAPTIRKRLFVIARCDGEPIVWPEPTHGAPTDHEVVAGRKLPWRTAAECIDWSIPCPSIFLTKEEGRAIGVNRPLAANTMARIAKGVQRYVIDAPHPYIVKGAAVFASRGQHGGASRSVDAPIHTVTASLKDTNQIVAAFLAQHNTGMVGHDARKPLSTIVQRGTTQALVAAHCINLKGSDRRASAATEPAPTVTSGGNHIGEVRAFLIKYFGTDQDPRLDEPMHTVTTKDRFGLVTVHGEVYQIVDIGMRMLTPRELFRAQGFPDSYQIEIPFEGRILSKGAQTRMCGNSVSPVMARALVGANVRTSERVAA